MIPGDREAIARLGLAGTEGKLRSLVRARAEQRVRQRRPSSRASRQSGRLGGGARPLMGGQRKVASLTQASRPSQTNHSPRGGTPAGYRRRRVHRPARDYPDRGRGTIDVDLRLPRINDPHPPHSDLEVLLQFFGDPIGRIRRTDDFDGQIRDHRPGSRTGYAPILPLERRTKQRRRLDAAHDRREAGSQRSFPGRLGRSGWP